MSFLKNFTALLPIGKKGENLEYYFAINIASEKLTAALWTIEGKELKILGVASDDYSTEADIIPTTDKLLDQVLGLKEIEPQKILFGVPNSWLSDDNLKDEYLKTLRILVKELELTPMAYVATSHSLIHYLEKKEGVPTTAILVGFEKLHLTITVVRAGKVDGVKVITRGESSGLDIEKALLSFTDIETLPSKILIYGFQTDELKNQLLSFSWMSKLSFLHFPKIDVLGDDIEIKSVCLAGGSEISGDISYADHPIKKEVGRKNVLMEESVADPSSADSVIAEDQDNIVSDKDNFGFVVGDIVKTDKSIASNTEEEPLIEDEIIQEEETRDMVAEQQAEIDEFQQEQRHPVSHPHPTHKSKFNFRKTIAGNFTIISLFFGVLAAILLTLGFYLFLIKADIKVFVEPTILERDAQVIADPTKKDVNDEGKIIPGQIVETEVSGTTKDTATGRKQIGDPAKGTVVIYNKTSAPLSLSKGTQITGSDKTKFTLDTSVTIASQSASDSGITFGKTTTTVTASVIGADGNLPSGSDFDVSGYSSDKLAAKSEGNFSGGTSKDVTVVSSEDTQRVLASLASDLRKQAQQKLQEKYPDKKILEEALQESITKKNYSKNVNDQASEFSLNMTVKYKGTAYDDAHLRTIVSKLVNTQVPEGFQLDLTETETQADVSKLEKDGKLVFLAKFRAKLMPKIDSDKIKNQIKFKSPTEAIEILKNVEHVLGSEVKITPSLPQILERLPFFTKNINIEIGLK